MSEKDKFELTQQEKLIEFWVILYPPYYLSLYLPKS